MLKPKKAAAYRQLFLLIPFFIIALIPRGMMLAPGFSSLSNLLIICPAYSYGSHTANHHQAMGHHSETSELDPRDSSCPYSVPNSSYIDTSTILAIPNIATITPTLLAHYRVQYLINSYPAGLPRGPPLFA